MGGAERGLGEGERRVGGGGRCSHVDAGAAAAAAAVRTVTGGGRDGWSAGNDPSSLSDAQLAAG